MLTHPPPPHTHTRTHTLSHMHSHTHTLQWTVGMDQMVNPSYTMDTHSPPRFSSKMSWRPSRSMRLLSPRKYKSLNVHFQVSACGHERKCKILRYTHTRTHAHTHTHTHTHSHTSSYPVILSIENHCSIPQQHRMAEMMKDILGELLCDEPRDEDKDLLPCPENLKRKILVKVCECFKHYPGV